MVDWSRFPNKHHTNCYIAIEWIYKVLHHNRVYIQGVTALLSDHTNCYITTESLYKLLHHNWVSIQIVTSLPSHYTNCYITTEWPYKLTDCLYKHHWSTITRHIQPSLINLDTLTNRVYNHYWSIVTSILSMYTNLLLQLWALWLHSLQMVLSTSICFVMK